MLNDNALTTLDNVKTELGLTTTGSDDYLERQINTYSDFFERRTEKKWYRSEVTESAQSFGDTRLQVSEHLPIQSVSEVKIYDDVVSGSNYEVEDADVGWIRYDDGTFESTVVQKRRVEHYDHTYEYKAQVSYDGGYITPYQATTGTYSGSQVTLPLDIEQAVIQTVTNKYRLQGSANNIQSEQLGDASVDYSKNINMTQMGGMEVSPGLESAINFYKKRRVY